MATSEEMAEQAAVFAHAVDEYERRDAVHQGLWKTMDMAEEDQLINHKAKRWAHTRHEEDAIDLINYVAFSIRNQRRRNQGDST